jgi:hypothetical protein
MSVNVEPIAALKDRPAPASSDRTYAQPSALTPDLLLLLVSFACPVERAVPCAEGPPDAGGS